jgi:K+ transporter
VFTPVFVPYVLPITVAILIALFAVQSHGTARIGSIFGPVMLLWFAVLAILGVLQLVKQPAVLAAINPWYAVHFFAGNGWHGYLVLGSVFLAVTGGEALYADMGHFGLLPIRLTWFGFVLPALLLNYFGQGALVTTWFTGRRILAERIAERSQSMEEFRRDVAAHPPLRVPGTAIYLARDPSISPPPLVQNLKHNKVLHERVVLLAITTTTSARVEEAKRIELTSLGDNMFRVVARNGFIEESNVPVVIERLRAMGLDIDLSTAIFVLGRETLLVTKRPGMAMWRERLFARLARNARRATKYFHLPSESVMELGTEIEL